VQIFRSLFQNSLRQPVLEQAFAIGRAFATPERGIYNLSLFKDNDEKASSNTLRSELAGALRNPIAGDFRAGQRSFVRERAAGSRDHHAGQGAKDLAISGTNFLESVQPVGTAAMRYFEANQTGSFKNHDIAVWPEACPYIDNHRQQNVDKTPRRAGTRAKKAFPRKPDVLATLHRPHDLEEKAIHWWYRFGGMRARCDGRSPYAFGLCR
jgi:hypothetical protein